jgi:hypothetical protein
MKKVYLTSEDIDHIEKIIHYMCEGGYEEHIHYEECSDQDKKDHIYTSVVGLKKILKSSQYTDSLERFTKERSK